MRGNEPSLYSRLTKVGKVMFATLVFVVLPILVFVLYIAASTIMRG